MFSHVPKYSRVFLLVIHLPISRGQEIFIERLRMGGMVTTLLPFYMQLQRREAVLTHLITDCKFLFQKVRQQLF